MSPLLVLQNLAHNSTATLAVVKVRNNYHYEGSEIYRHELVPILLPVTLSALVKVGKEGASKERRGGFVYSKLKKKEKGNMLESRENASDQVRVDFTIASDWSR